MLLVGNHTGGNMAPEVIVLPLAFSTFFGVERPFYQLARGDPSRWARSCAVTVSDGRIAQPREARPAPGAAVLVFPGGDWEVHRPSWERNKVDLRGPPRGSSSWRSPSTCRSSRW